MFIILRFTVLCNGHHCCLQLFFLFYPCIASVTVFFVIVYIYNFGLAISNSVSLNTKMPTHSKLTCPNNFREVATINNFNVIF